MNPLSRALADCRVEWYQLRKDARVPLILALVAIIELQYTNVLFEYGKSVSADSTPWLLPMINATAPCRFILLGCAALFFSNVLHNHRGTVYYVSRSGRYSYLAGKILYSLTLSFCFTVFVSFAFCLFHIRHIYWDTGWGPLLGSWARYYAQSTSAGPVSTIIQSMSAGQAMLWTFLLLWLSFINMALIVLFFQLFGLNTVSVIILAALLLLELLTNGNGLQILSSTQAHLVWISPLSWSNLSLLSWGTSARVQEYPPLGYAVWMSILLMVLLMGLIFGAARVAGRPGGRIREIRWDV